MNTLVTVTVTVVVVTFCNNYSNSQPALLETKISAHWLKIKARFHHLGNSLRLKWIGSIHICNGT